MIDINLHNAIIKKVCKQPLICQDRELIYPLGQDQHPFEIVSKTWVSTRPLTYKSSRLFNNPLVTVSKAPITIGIIVTFMSHSFFNSLARSR